MSAPKCYPTNASPEDDETNHDDYDETNYDDYDDDDAN